MNLYKLFFIAMLFQTQLLSAGKSVFGHINNNFKDYVNNTIATESGMVEIQNKYTEGNLLEATRNKERADKIFKLIDHMVNVVKDAQKEGYKEYDEEDLFKFITEKYAYVEKLKEAAKKRYNKFDETESVSDSSDDE